MDDSHTIGSLMLAAFAVLHSFDLSDLRTILVLDELPTSALLDDEMIEPIVSGDDFFRVRPAQQLVLLENLRRSRPRDELTLHSRAFQCFLQRLRESDDLRSRFRFEDACVHHLRALRDLNLDYRRWDEVMLHVGALRAALPHPQTAHDACIAGIEAYHAMRHQEYQRSEAILRTLLALTDLPARLRAETLLIQGLCKLNQAQFERARSDFLAAQALGVATNDQSVQGRALINISWMHNDLAQYEQALRCSQKSLIHFQQAGDYYGAASAFYSIGNNALSLGQWELGQQHLEQAAEIYALAGMEPSLAMVDWGRGLLHQMLGNDALSEQAYLRALSIAISANHGNLVVAADCHVQLGLLYQTIGSLDLAAESYLHAIELAIQLNDDLRRALVLHRYGQLQWQQGDQAGGLRSYISAVDLIESLRVSTEGEGMKIDLLGTTQQVYETIVLAYSEQGNNAAVFAYIERARARAFLDLVARRSGTIDTLVQNSTIGLRDLQACLAPDTLLLEYYTVGVVPPQGSFQERVPVANTRLRRLLTIEPEILLLAVTTDQVKLHRLAIDPNQLQPPLDDPTPGWHLFTERKLTWLYTKLLARVADSFASVRLLQIIPHGPLHYVPFAALHERGGATLLAPGGPAIAYAPSATVLCGCIDQPAVSEHLALAIGYNDKGTLALRYAEREAVLVSELTGAQVQVGSMPKRLTLFEIAPRLQWLHIAGHAFFQANDPLGSFLRIGDNDDVDARTLMGNLKLSGALVTLNACTSGLSHIASGDELLGLTRAFLYAGAATMVCALHKVDDLAAYVLMFFFYTNLVQGQSPAIALHNAQQSLRTTTRGDLKVLQVTVFEDEAALDAGFALLDDEMPFAPPRYWAPFMVIGKP